MAVSIWRDYIVSIGTSSSYYVRVRLDDASGEIVYTGRCFKRPGATNATVKLNDIVADHLYNSLKTSSGFLADCCARTFTLQYSSNGSSWTTKANYVFIRCWDYVTQSITSDFCLPVTKRMPSWALLPVTTVDSSGTISVGLYSKPGGTGTLLTTRTATKTAPGTGWINVSYTGAKSAKFGTTTVDLDSCADWVLYFVNLKGGWSVLPADGGLLAGDTFTRKTFMPDYYNLLSPPEHGKVVLATEVAERYALRTAPLTTAEAANMKHVMRTPFAYLASSSGTVIPVIVTDASADYVSRRNGASGLPVYTVNLEVAEYRMSK